MAMRTTGTVVGLAALAAISLLAVLGRFHTPPGTTATTSRDVLRGKTFVPYSLDRRATLARFSPVVIAGIGPVTPEDLP